MGLAMKQIVQITFMSWVPAFLMRAQHIEEDKAGMILGVIGLLSIIGVPWEISGRSLAKE